GVCVVLSGQARHCPVGRKVGGADVGLPGVHLRLGPSLTLGREVISFHLAAESGSRVTSRLGCGCCCLGVRVLFENSIVCRCTNLFFVLISVSARSFFVSWWLLKY